MQIKVFDDFVMTSDISVYFLWKLFFTKKQGIFGARKKSSEIDDILIQKTLKNYLKVLQLFTICDKYLKHGNQLSMSLTANSTSQTIAGKTVSGQGGT